MFDLNQIKNILMQQNLSSYCTCDIPQGFSFFKNVTIAFNINKHEPVLSNSLITKHSIPYITFNESAMEFEYHMARVTKSLDTSHWEQINENNSVEVRWIKNTQNEYIITYPSGSNIGTIIQSVLPTIYIGNRLTT